MYIRKAKTKALISYAVTAQLISAFVFAYAKIQLLVHFMVMVQILCILYLNYYFTSTFYVNACY